MTLKKANPTVPQLMAFEFKLPDIGEGVMEGEIVKWLVSPGDSVEIDQPMVEVMTDKATVVIPSPRQGRVAEIRGAEGDVVAVGATIVVIDEGGAAASAPDPEAAPVAHTPSDLGTAAAAQIQDRSAAVRAPAARALEIVPPVGERRALAAPATRRLARELGVDLETVAGSGPAGRVMATDVRQAAAAAEAPSPASTPATPTEDEDEVIPVRGVRGRIWDSMTRSAFTAPHFTFVEECDVTELQAYRKRLNAHVDDESPRLTFLPFIIKAVCVALEEMPDLNGQVDDAQRAFIRRRAKHIGIAVAAEKGLTVPVVRNADRRSLLDLSREVRRLADAVREGQVAASDLGGSTFTVTSLGREGGLLATPILNYPEVGILGVHRLQKRPMVGDGDEVVIRSMMNLSLSCDHRWVDGHRAAQFAYRVIELLEEPERLVLHMGS